MSGQTDRTALSLSSTGGDVILVGQTTYLSKDAASGGSATLNRLAGNIYPSQVRIAALNGSVINSTLYTMPGSSPELRIIAAKDILPGSILMGRATPAMIPSPFEPVAGTTTVTVNIGDMGGILANPIGGRPFTPHAVHLWLLSNPEQLPNANDYEPSRIYALTGSIIGSLHQPNTVNPPPFITTNEQTWFRAGVDIRNIYYNLRNIHPTDVSLLEAGNDIIGGVGPMMPVTGGFSRLGGQIEIQGPGALVLAAGRDVYGTELTLYSRGNRSYDASNRPILEMDILGLPEQGAAITVIAGLKGKQPSYDAFMAAYLDPANLAAMPDYLKVTFTNNDDDSSPYFTRLPFPVEEGTVVPLYFLPIWEERGETNDHLVNRGLVWFVVEVSGPVSSFAEAWARFQALPQLTRERFLRQIYMQELRDAGSDQLEPGENGLPRNGGYNRGYAAIETLFPGQDWKGDVAIGNAFFRTMSGGDIEILAPGGGLQVAALGAAVPKEYGLVTLGYGNINIFARDDVTVNRSRVLTFAGGDEIIWSTLGDIDAGRGAKTVRVPSAPEVQTDFETVTRVFEKADIAGSGIGTVIGFTGVEEGDVHLIAPQGTVNAGDAGVRVSGNLTVAAQVVLNADNFDVAGEVKGVPQETAPVSLKVDSGSEGQKAASEAAAAATRQASRRQDDLPSIITVEVIGYGGGDGTPHQDLRQDAPSRRRSDVQTQNPGSRVQVIGAGDLTVEQTRQLIEERRRQVRH
jgi:hypothetical protein